MLKLNDFRLKKDILIILMEEPQVDEIVGGVHLSKEEVNRKKANTTIRIGRVLKHGELTENTLQLLSLWGNSTPTSLVDENVIFAVHGLDAFDIPIENYKNAPIVSIKLDYLLGTINVEDEAK